MSERYLLSASEIAAMPGLEKSHFLNPAARRLNRSLGDATGLVDIGVHLIEVAAGDATTEYHRHLDEDEAVYVLSGHATARIGAERLAIGPGDFIGYRKGGLAHAIENTGTELLRLLVVGARRGHDAVDYPDLGKRLYRGPDRAPDLVDISDISHPVMGAKR